MKRSAMLTVALLAALLAVPPIAAARDAKTLRVGAVSLRPFSGTTLNLVFLKRMAELGYERGRNFTF